MTVNPGVDVQEQAGGGPQLQAALGLKQQPRHPAVDDWFLAAHERGNDATRCAPGPRATPPPVPLVHGCSYLPAIADTLTGSASSA